MLTFLNSFFAWLLAAALIPLLIHLFTRKKLQKVKFSSLQFLQAMQNEKIRQVRLKQLLLLLLRTVVILLIVLAFMRPTLREMNFIGGKAARTSMVIILDNSLSMSATARGQSKFALAKKRANEILQQSSKGDDVSIIAASFPAEIVEKRSVVDYSEIHRELLKNIVQTASRNDFVGALRKALQILSRTENLNKEIYWISDQKLMINSDREQFSFPDNLLFYHVNLAKSTLRNLTVAELSVENQIFDVQKVVGVKASVANTGDLDEQDRIVSLYLNDKRVAQEQVTVPSSQERQVFFRVVPEKAGYQLLNARVENDQVPLDDEAYTIFYIETKLRVLIIGPQEDDRLYIRLALASLQSREGIEIREAAAKELDTINLSKYRAIVFCNFPSFKSLHSRKIQRFIEDGGGAIFFLGENVDLRNYNASIFKDLQLGTLGETLGNIEARNEALRLGRISFDHPVFQDMFQKTDGEPGIDSPLFHFAVRALPQEEVKQIMEYSNGMPFLLEKSIGNGRVFCFLSAANDTWSDLTFKGIFAPLITRSVRYVAGKSDLAGKKIEVGTPAMTSITGQDLSQFMVEIPGGFTKQIKPQIRSGRYFVSFPATKQAGFYRLLIDGRLRYVWAANSIVEEMRTKPYDLARFQSHFGIEKLTSIDPEDNPKTELARIRYGEELWQLFILAAFLGLIIEMFVLQEKSD